MSAEPVQEADLQFTVHDVYAMKTYEMNETINESGIYLDFYPPLSVCNLCHTKEDYIEGWYLTENHALEIPILDDAFLLSCLELNRSTKNSKACLAKEEQHVFLNPYDCNNGPDDSANYIDISGEKYAFSDFSPSGEIIMCKIDSSGACQNLTPISSLGEDLVLPDDSTLHVWLVASGYTKCARWVEVSHFSYVVELEDGVNGIELTWTEKAIGKDIPGLKSIYISANSTAYQRLT